MHNGSLVQVALQAERIRLQRMVRQAVHRSAFAVTGLFFLGATFVFLEVAGYCWLLERTTSSRAALVCGGANLLVALISLVLAATSRQDAVARDARIIRDDAWERLMGGVAIGVLLGPIHRRLGGKSVVGITLAALVSAFLGIGRQVMGKKRQAAAKDIP